MGIKVLFIDPNIFGMNMLTPAIALFSSILKKKGHNVDLFDTTYYPLNETLDFDMDSGTRKMEKLEVVPYDMASRGVSIKTSNWRNDIQKKLREFEPDLIAMCETESIWDLGIIIL